MVKSQQMELQTELIESSVEEINKHLTLKRKEEEKSLLISISSSVGESSEGRDRLSIEENMKEEAEGMKDSSEEDEAVQLFKKVDSEEVFSDRKIVVDPSEPQQPVGNTSGVSTFAKKRQMCLIQNISVVISPQK